uniref:Uncharacterized protein n=1 Tax=Neogobius melanostomus TaxID=47308 RepID=A0A8C6U875_9GOBI
MVVKVFFPQCCNRADSGLLVGRCGVKQYIQQVRADPQRRGALGARLVEFAQRGSGRRGQLPRDLSTIFPQRRWLQISREMGKMGFSCSERQTRRETPR